MSGIQLAPHLIRSKVAIPTKTLRDDNFLQLHRQLLVKLHLYSDLNTQVYYLINLLGLTLNKNTLPVSLMSIKLTIQHFR